MSKPKKKEKKNGTTLSSAPSVAPEVGTSIDEGSIKENTSDGTSVADKEVLSSPDMNEALDSVVTDTDEKSVKNVLLSVPSEYSVSFWTPSDPLNRVAVGTKQFSLIGDNLPTIKESKDIWSNNRLMSFVQQNFNFGKVAMPQLPYLDSHVFSTKGKYSSVTFRDDFKLPSDVTNLKLLTPRIMNALYTLNIHGYEVSDYQKYIGQYVTLEVNDNGKITEAKRIDNNKQKSIIPVVRNKDTLFSGNNSDYNADFTPHSKSKSWSIASVKGQSTPYKDLEVSIDKVKPLPYDNSLNGIAIPYTVKNFFYQIARLHRSYAASIYEATSTKVDLLSYDLEAFASTIIPMVNIGTMCRILLYSLVHSLRNVAAMADKQGVLSPFGYAYAMLKPFQRNVLSKNLKDFAQLISAFPYNKKVYQDYQEYSKPSARSVEDLYDYNNPIFSPMFMLQVNVNTDWVFGDLGKKKAVETCKRIVSRIGGQTFFLPTHTTFGAFLGKVFGLMPRRKDSTQRYTPLYVSPTEITDLQFSLMLDLMSDDSDIIKFLFELTALSSEWLDQIRGGFDENEVSTFGWDGIQEPDLSLAAFDLGLANHGLLSAAITDHRLALRSNTGIMYRTDPEDTLYSYVLDINGNYITTPCASALTLVTSDDIHPTTVPSNSLNTNLISVTRVESTIGIAFLLSSSDLKLTHPKWVDIDWSGFHNKITFTKNSNQYLHFAPLMTLSFNWASKWAKTLRAQNANSGKSTIYYLPSNAYTTTISDANAEWLLYHLPGLSEDFETKKWVNEFTGLSTYINNGGKYTEIGVPSFTFKIYLDPERLFLNGNGEKKQ